MLRQGFAAGFHRGHDLHLRVHVLPELCRAAFTLCVPELRWRIYGQANTASKTAGEISRIREAHSQSQLRGSKLAGYDTMNPAPVLEGSHVRLEPLSLKHLDGLCAVGLDESLWQWTTIRVRSREEMVAYVESALEEQRRGTALMFATTLKTNGQVVGSTGFGSMDLKNRRVEIGWTWIGVRWQRTAVNTEAKYLMLCHAFETFGCRRVEFKTDVLNQCSRRAILRLGAKEEGILRKHMSTYSGRVRDSVYYSIVDDEWPSVKVALQAKLQAHTNRSAA